MDYLIKDIIKVYPGTSYSVAVQIASYRWHSMSDIMKERYIIEKEKEEEQIRNKGNTGIFIMIYFFIKHMSKLKQEELHALYISLLAQEMQKESIKNIDLINKEKNLYYSKYGRWYEKILSFIK